MSDNKLWTCQVADYLGVSTRTVTRYADKGLLRFTKTPGGHRRYNWKDVRRLKCGPRE